MRNHSEAIRKTHEWSVCSVNVLMCFSPSQTLRDSPTSLRTASEGISEGRAEGRGREEESTDGPKPWGDKTVPETEE